VTHDRHLSEDRLIDFCLRERGSDELDPVRAAVVRAHLAACERCTRQYAEIAGLLDATHEEAAARADEHFPESRLSAQFDRIMRRVDHLGRPGQVISFPLARRVPQVVETATGATRRWAAVAAVASLLVGFAAGRLVTRSELRTATPVASATHATAPRATPPPAPKYASADDAFVSLDLSEIDLADTDRPVVLQAYDAMTPTVQEVSLTGR
jgi:anti-sigma factor RsiW